MLPYFRSMEAFFNLSLPKPWADLSDPQLLFFFRQLATDKPMAEIQALCLCQWINVLVRCRLYGSVYLVQHGKQQATLTLHQFVCAITAIILLILRSFQRKGLCNSGLKAKSTTFVRNITTIRLRSQFVILKMNINMTDKIGKKEATFAVPYNGEDNNDYVDGKGFCCNDGSLEAAQTRALARAAKNNFQEGDTYEKMQFYYHPDHLGSSSYITNLDGEVVQHIEYVPFGEVFMEERNNFTNRVVMKAMIILLVFSCLLFSCSNNSREKSVDSSELSNIDYRLFQNTPAWELAKAVQEEDMDNFDKIISENPQIINYQESKYGNTLLMLTIINQQLKPFKALLKKGAAVNTHNTFDGTSPLIEACSSKYYNIIFTKILIEYGANINDIETGKRRQENSTRLTPLMAASKTGNLDLVRFLVSNGADVNYQNEFGQSALSESVMTDNYKVAYYLLQNGANYNLPIFYRYDYSIPIENSVPGDKGKPMFLMDVLKEDESDSYTDEYKYKTLIIDFLKEQGG